MTAIRALTVRLSIQWLLLLHDLHELPVTACLVDESGSAIRDVLAALLGA
ncbi:hypothetical protein [Curtobacterium sp. DN_7.5]|nr:hypothetical protein [Curtobacterium sp. DN_7.5]